MHLPRCPDRAKRRPAAAPTRHTQRVQSGIKALASAALIIVPSAGRPVGVYDEMGRLWGERVHKPWYISSGVYR
jgi:hypothetical protein